MSDAFMNKPVARAWLIVNSVPMEIQPLCGEGYNSLSDQLCDCISEGMPFVVWGMYDDRFTVGPDILRNCILIEK